MAERIDGYVRVSRVGDRALRSDRQQRAAIEREAHRLGLRLDEIVEDLDQSGGREDRPGLTLILERIERGEISGLMVTRLDRFSRDIVQALRLAERIENAGGRLYVIEEPIDLKSPDGALMVQMRLAIATHQRRLANAYFEKSKADAVARGVPIQPRLPPGIRSRVDDGGKRVALELDADVAPLIRELFERRVAGAGPAELADFLTSYGVTTSMGAKSWSKQAVYGLLKNRIYLGELRQGEHVNTAALPAMVDRATWEAAQPGRAVTKTAAGRTDAAYLLTGLLRCASCRYCLQGTTTSRGKRIYRCNARHAGGRCQAPARIDAEEAEAAVLGAFRDAVKDRRSLQATPDTAQLDAAQDALDRAERELALLRDDADLRDAIGRDAWLTGLRERRVTVEEAESELARVRAATPPAPTIDARAIVDELDDMPRRDVRTALAVLIDVIALRPKGAKLAPRQRVVIFWAGDGPRDLPRRGFRERPGVRPFELPPMPAIAAG